MNFKRFLCLGLLIAALIVSACSPQAAPEPTATPKPATSTPVPPTATAAPTATTSAPTVSEAEVPMGFTEDGLPYRGNPDAPVTLEEHSEFQ
jgi:hypothetical protein